MASTGTLKALGLNLSTNQLEVQPGSLVQASNIIIRRDDVMEPRRGFKLFGDSFGISTDRAKQLFTYRNRILRHFATTLQFQNGVNNDGTVNFDSFAGNYEETQPGLRIKSIESNGNFYFTTADGIKKISAKTADQLSTTSNFITNAGGIKALDMTASLYVTQGSQTGFLPQDSTVAYRHLWATYDANNNLILGTPSQRVEVYNNLSGLLTTDLNTLLLRLDELNQTGSLITDGNYVSTLGLDPGASASEVRTNLIALAAKLDNDIVITEDTMNVSTSQRITTTTATLVFSADVSARILTGDVLKTSGFSNTDFNSRTFTVTNVSTTTVSVSILSGGNFGATDGAPVAETGASTVRRNKYTLITQPGTPDTPPTNQELVDIQTYLSDIIINLQSEPTGIISSPLEDEFLSNLDITTSSNVKLTITIPEEVTSNYFLQIYRSAIKTATGATVLSDLIADDEMQLVYEAYPTSAELVARTMTVIDVTPDAFRGANLYTNEATGEGIAQANDIPPFAKDINKFKNVVFYANTRTRQRKSLSLLGVSNMLIDYNNGLDTQTFTSANVNTATDTITIAAHGYIEDQAVRFTTTGTLPGGINQNQTYYILNVDTNTFQLSLTRQSTQPIDLTTGGTGTHTIRNILPSFSISDGTIIQTYTFIKGIKEVTDITAVADVANSLNGTYFLLNSANDSQQYYVWYKTSGGTENDPLVPNKTGIKVLINTGETANNVALKTGNTIKSTVSDFTVTISTNTLRTTNTDFGYTTDASAGTSGFTISVVTQGQGENATLKQILLSDNISPAIAVDETARSLVRVINQNSSDIVYAYYLSTANTVPGLIFLEGRSLSGNSFYIIANSEGVGASFSPNISPDNVITNISAANPTVITSLNPHGLISGNQVVIANSNSTPSIDGIKTVTVLSANTFSIPVNVTVAGNFAVFSSTDNAEASENELKPNRIYYSKVNQPEAVPLTNFFDVGSQDKEILRIFPLRDSLFVFKEDGLYRVSGEIAPFSLALFDGSCNLIASDSLGLESNLIYGWTDQGIQTISESGVSNPLSRPIDTAILKLATQQYTNFKTATWGIGYHSDNAYYAFTISSIDDVEATICYRFSSLTGTWTTLDKTDTCGILNSLDDKLYLGCGDTNFIEQERKDFTRYDYADREISTSVDDGNYFGKIIKFVDVTQFKPGDVLVQEQPLSLFEYNMLLKKLDIDPDVSDSNYYSLLKTVGGANLRNSIVALAQKLDADPGVADTNYFSTIDAKSGPVTTNSIASPTVITSVAHGLFTGRVILISGSNSVPSANGTYQVTFIDANHFSIDLNVTTAGTTGSWITLNNNFDDIKACYNKIIQKINNDVGVGFNNYMEATGSTIQESIVESINKVTKKVTFNVALEYIVGPTTLFKAFKSEITYCPYTAGDALDFKQFRQSTLMFDSKAFTKAEMNFSTDLLPVFHNVPFNGDGNGIFGIGTGGFGEGFFGGGSHAVPFRTFIPRNCQRCRFINVNFTHQIARESFSIYGLTLSYEVYALGERAYRS